MERGLKSAYESLTTEMYLEIALVRFKVKVRRSLLPPLNFHMYLCHAPEACWSRSFPTPTATPTLTKQSAHSCLCATIPRREVDTISVWWIISHQNRKA